MGRHAGYRNVIGLPGGVDSPFFPILQEANVNGMRLLPGNGNEYDPRWHRRCRRHWLSPSNAGPLPRRQRLPSIPAEYVCSSALLGGRPAS